MGVLQVDVAGVLPGVMGGVIRGSDMTDSDRAVPTVVGSRSLRKVANECTSSGRADACLPAD